MNNAYAMAATLEEKRHKTQAYMITGGFVGLMLLLMFLLKWTTPLYEQLAQESGIDVEITLPPDPPEPPQSSNEESGGGGGNQVQAAGAAGVASYTPPTTSKEVDEEDDKANPEVTTPKAVAPKSPRVNENSVAKAEPKPVVETPAPKTPKAVLGKTTYGNGKGGGAAEDYDRAGGRGNGTGVGTGNGTGGGTGNGTGGGNGTGSGTGSGPKVTRGDRKIIRYYSFEGDLDKAVVYANISVSPEGVGKFLSIAKGSSNSNGAYKSAIMQYLQNIKFDKADHESMLTVQFNFRVN
ncbi:MAG TPA: hypothetical protein VGO58_16830 [Chitinophagaceae bacterium]|jgi:hypothetical protein|nr:hypothetical protein [Chitinophagaceae bacterium]